MKSYTERFPNIACLAARALELEAKQNAAPTRDELTAAIIAALESDTASYTHLHAAAALLTDGGGRQ